MAAGEEPVASGSVASGTVEEPAAAGLIDTPTLQHLLQRSPGGAASGPRPAGDHAENLSILDSWAGLGLVARNAVGHRVHGGIAA
jgi:hypothetical protein